MNLGQSTILVTGGTGSFGKRFVRHLLAEHHPAKIVIYSRDELKQYEMQVEGFDHPSLRFFLGDVRDKERLARAFDGVDYVVHAAALKQVPAAEYNPFEAIKTNVLGAQNVIDCAIDKGVRRVVALSTDKAVNPVNLYGATKLCSDKLFVGGNAYAGGHETRFSVVRYGNVVGSRGSVVPLFLKRRHQGVLPLTDPRMTRFWITLEQGVRFVLDCLEHAVGGEVFVPKLPSLRMTDLARVIAPGARIETIGIRPGEKLHEVMVPADEARHTVELHDRYVILPQYSSHGELPWAGRGRLCPDGFHYASDTNDRWLADDELARMIAGLDLPDARAWASERGLA